MIIPESALIISEHIRKSSALLVDRGISVIFVIVSFNDFGRVGSSLRRDLYIAALHFTRSALVNDVVSTFDNSCLRVVVGVASRCLVPEMMQLALSSSKFVSKTVSVCPCGSTPSLISPRSFIKIFAMHFLMVHL